MFDKVLLSAIASALTVVGVAVLWRRQVSQRGRLGGRLGLVLAGASFLGAGGLGAYAWLFAPEAGTGSQTAVLTPRETPPEEESEPLAPAPTKPVDPDQRARRLVIGTWTDNYQGKRTMTLREDGTGTMVCELTGLSATLFAERLQFEMVWSLDEGRLKKQTVGGEPAGKVQLVLKMMGDRVDEPILQLDEERLVLLDKDGTTEYRWTRAG